MKSFDLIVVGGGSAGFVAAFKAKAANLTVALAEKHKLGGECPNYACLPSKAMLRSAEVLHLAENAEKFGVRVKEAHATLPEIVSSKEPIIQMLTGSPRLENALKRNDVAYLFGEAKFVDEHTVEVAGSKYQAKQFVIATGSDPFIPPIEGLKETGFIDSIAASMLKVQPKRIAIIGGGAVGSEYTQLFTRLHTQVYLIQRGERILDREDEETSKVITESFTSQGVKIFTNTDVIKAEKVSDGKKLTLKTKDGQEEIIVDEVLVAPGRRPDLTKLNLEAAGVKLDEKGKLILDDYLRTTQSHIWAAGDVAGRYLFTHVAAYEGDIVGWNLTHPDQLRKPDYRVVPRATFTHPEIGSVGLTEKEAKDKGHDVIATAYPLKVMGRGLTVREVEGFIKLVVEQKSGQILGGHMVGAQAGEVIHEIALAMFANLPVQKLGEMIHAFPTMAEAVSFVTERMFFQMTRNVVDKS
ncbi:MAG: NAD(P)/FAD-dependent oxidoreductase [Candidatus Doudnabacteria bacterium]|nr:NAD(P)/FAD-dependent oxidoreductase [Candidatus Doudnabacteria bacterium]